MLNIFSGPVMAYLGLAVSTRRQVSMKSSSELSALALLVASLLTAAGRRL